MNLFVIWQRLFHKFQMTLGHKSRKAPIWYHHSHCYCLVSIINFSVLHHCQMFIADAQDVLFFEQNINKLLSFSDKETPGRITTFKCDTHCDGPMEENRVHGYRRTKSTKLFRVGTTHCTFSSNFWGYVTRSLLGTQEFFLASSPYRGVWNSLVQTQ